VCDPAARPGAAVEVISIVYRALYRKWRPVTFDDVVGQEHITETLKRQVETGRFSHAYLFTGTRGTGKTTCAKLLAKAVNCLNPVAGNPCNSCSACTGIDSGAVLDVTEMDAASNNGVENVRSLRDEAIYAPAALKRRVYIIDEVHMLSGSAFNALLKILEEPPEHLVFILATTELHKVPATILSRCQRYSFRRINPAVIVDRLMRVAREEGMTLAADAAELLARLADGSMRDALSLLDQCSTGGEIDRQRVLSAVGAAENDEICSLFDALAKGDSAAVIGYVEALHSSGKDVSSLLEQLSTLVRDLLINIIAPGGALLSGSFSAAALDARAGSMETERLLRSLEGLQDCIASLDRSPDRKLAAEICLLRLSGSDSVRSEPVIVKPAELPAAIVHKPTAEPSAPAAAAMPDPVPARTPTAEYPSEPTREPEAALSPVPEKSALKDVNWQAILDKARPGIDEHILRLLSDSAHASAEILPGRLNVYVKSPFAMVLTDTAAVKLSLKSAAEALCSGSVIVTVQEAAGDDQARHDRLDKLMAFDNVTIE